MLLAQIIKQHITGLSINNADENEVVKAQHDVLLNHLFPWSKQNHKNLSE